jgi:7-keto-8-aminopelargonate synthetase-like enzyme
LPPQQPPAAAAAAVAATTATNSSSSRRRTSAEIPPKTRYKQKQNEIHYENSTHFIRLTLSKVETPPLAVLHNTSENTVGKNHY